MFCNMTTLENAPLAVAEAFLKFEKLTNKEFNETSNIELLGEADKESQSSNQGGAETGPILLTEVLQNFILHLFIASQAAGKVYDKVSHLGPRHSSTKVMAETVKEAERHTLNTVKSPVKRKNEVIWKSEHSHEKPSGRYTPAKPSQPMYPQKQTMYPQKETRHTQKDRQYQEAVQPFVKTPMLCFKCGQAGHLKRDCDRCAYCKIKGHTPKTCQRRIKDVKGKFCSNCRIFDLLDTKECRKAGQTVKRNRAHLADASDEQIPYDEYWPMEGPILQQEQVYVEQSDSSQENS